MGAQQMEKEKPERIEFSKHPAREYTQQSS
jgi:hypothetical protein